MRDMKDSGIEWVKEIPKTWDVMANKYVMKKVKQVNPKYNDEDILSLTINGVIVRDLDTGGKMPSSFDGYQTLYPGNLLMCLFDYDVTPRCIGLIRNYGVTSPAYSQFEMKPDFAAEYYYYYYLMVDHTKALLHLAKNLRHSFTEDQLGTIPVPVPPITEQRHIASFLNKKAKEISESIFAVENEINKLDDYKQSIISEAVTKGLNRQVKMRESGIRWVSHLPAHWPIIPSKYLFRDSDVRKQAGEVQLTASQKYGIISQEEYMERENAKVVLANQGLDDWKHVEPYDFVISLRSFQGGLEMSETTGCITWHYVVLKATKPIYPKFYKWLFKSSMYITAIQRTCNFIRDGQDLRYSNFSQVPLYEPPLKEQKEIADYLDKKCAEIDAVIASKQKQLETLDAYKKSLIFEYVTGKKEVINHGDY